MLHREKQLGIDETIEIAKTVAGALDYAHRQEVVHRDIKAENILRLVVGHGARLSLLGVLLGFAAALALARFVAGLLFGVPPRDPATIVAVALVLSAVALLACFLPARRATRTNPMLVLRAE